MFRKPTFWVVLVLVAAASAWFGIANFSRAFPIVSLDITMDRASALASARDLEATAPLRPVRLPAGRLVPRRPGGADVRRVRRPAGRRRSTRCSRRAATSRSSGTCGTSARARRARRRTSLHAARRAVRIRGHAPGEGSGRGAQDVEPGPGDRGTRCRRVEGRPRDVRAGREVARRAPGRPRGSHLRLRAAGRQDRRRPLPAASRRRR